MQQSKTQLSLLRESSLGEELLSKKSLQRISSALVSSLKLQDKCTAKSKAADSTRQCKRPDDLCDQMNKFVSNWTTTTTKTKKQQNVLKSIQRTPGLNDKLFHPLNRKKLCNNTIKINLSRHTRNNCNENRASSYKFINLKSLIRFSLAALLILIFLSCHHGVAANQHHQDRHNIVVEAQQHAYDSIIASSSLSTSESNNSPSQQQQQQQQSPAAASSPSQSESSPQASVTSATSSSAACFGGLQTFEKISMSSFENPTSATGASSSGSGSNGGNGGSNSFGSGILIQQDDQALTSECINLCRSQSNCLSFVIDYSKFECKSYATTQQELQQEFATKFQSARAANGGSGGGGAGNSTGDHYSTINTDGTESQQNGYQSGAAAAASNVNFQQLLPSASSNYFEKICLDGVANRDQFSDVCGQGRLWTVERVVDSFLDGFVEKEVTNVNNKDECSKLCMFETQFVCRSADYDQHSRLCRLSKEDRRTQPQAMRYVAGSNRQYLENQCATPGPSSCVYETKKNVGIISMDALKFAQTVQDCQMKCNQELTFNCRSYSFHQQRCFLSGDDSVSLNSNLIKLPAKQGWTFGEKMCLVELCSKGLFSYEKITGFTLRSALSTSIDLLMSASSSSSVPSLNALSMMGNNQLPENFAQVASQTKLRYMLPPPIYTPSSSSPLALNLSTAQSQSPPTSSSSGNLASAMMMMMMMSPGAPPAANGADAQAIGGDPLHESASSSSGRFARSSSNLAITEHCRHSCDLGYLNCPAFTIDYRNNRCQRLDRNSQGRHHELVARDGFAYYEKICLRVPEIMSMCQDKYWIFERVIGYELAPRLYDKSLKFVLSRRDCEEYCLEEKQFQCRSALYNDETSDCKLSRYNRRLALQEGAYYRNFNARVSYLENNCVRDHNLDNKQQCYFEQAKDGPAYPTFTERIEMVTAGPPQSSSSSQPQSQPAATPELEMGEPSQFMRHQNGSSSSSSSSHRYGSSHCEQLCNDNSKFECHSFGYYASTAQCFLSGDDSVSAGEMATTSSTGFTYYEKKCRLMSGTMGGTNSTDDSGGGRNSGGIGTIISTTPTRPVQAPNQNPYFQPAIINRHMGTSMNGAGPSTSTAGQPAGEIDSTAITTTTTATTTSTASNVSTGTTTLVEHNHGSNINVHIDQQLEMHNNNRGQGSLPPRQHAGGTNSSMSTNTSSTGSEPDMYKCGIGYTFVYQRISGFEPIGGYLTLLVKNNDQPGIVGECSDLCKRAFECRAFVVDYNNNQCYAMLENSSVGMLGLRQTLGKDYFEGFCMANHLLLTGSNCRNRTWIVDKIVDQAVVGVQHQKLISDSDRNECRQACFEERLFWCKSAMFDSSTNDCKLYSIDRESVPQMRLLFTKGVDFYENLCQISSNSCPYDAIERDLTIVTVTKSVQARSTFDCELACNSEISFNCRSYTYLDQYPSLPNLCLLSSDSRSTSQRGSVHEHSKSLYAERNCYYRRPRYPGGGGAGGATSSSGPKYDSTYSTPAPVTPPLSAPSNSYDPYRLPSTAGNQNVMPALDGQLTPSDNSRYAPPTAPAPPPPLRIGTEQEGLAPNSYDTSLGPTTLGLGNCEPHQFTFERTFGYDFKLAPKERAPIAPAIGIAIGCQQECLRRGDKCQSFVVEYALPFQSCFLIETQAGSNKRMLIKSPNSAYFEKVCLPRTGVHDIGGGGAEQSLTHSPMLSPLADSGAPESMDIMPSYSQEPWSPQVPNQLPYYLQQQQLVQNYPSRSCAKLWSFERFVNYNFTAPADRVIQDSLTRSHCQTHCLNEAAFSCRSITYDYANKLCRLFKNTRRTILSHFVDLEVTTGGGGGGLSQQQHSSSNGLPDSHPGTAHVLIGGEALPGGDSIQTAASSLQAGTNFLGNRGGGAASDQLRRQGSARQLATPAASQTAEPSNASRNIDYLENTCTPEPSSCQYRQIYDQYSPYIDKVNHAISLGDCQRQCDQERLFSCKSINYDPISRNCLLVNEDLISLNRGQQQQNSLLPKKNAIYSEKGNCEMISVQCNSQEMLVSINFDSPFRGRVMAKGNPEQCYLLGDGQTNLQFSIVFGPKCNSRQEGHNTFVNEVVIQQHPVIMTESDKTVRVMCAFEAPDQTITLKNPTSRDNRTGIDVGTPDTSRTRHDKQQFNSVVSNKAAPPNVVLRILDQNGRDASMINLGDDLMLKIQMQMDGMKSSALGILARNLAARSSNGESLLLIDNEGCPVDPQVFPALAIDQKDGRSLQSTFKAFRFPSSGLVNFEVQIKFCPERCQPVDCHRLGQKSHSYGRRRKRNIEEDINLALDSGRAPFLQSATGPEDSKASQAITVGQPGGASLDSLSTVMKPGKAFEYIRKLMLPVSSESGDTIAQQAAAAGPADTAQVSGQTQSSVTDIVATTEYSNQEVNIPPNSPDKNNDDTLSTTTEFYHQQDQRHQHQQQSNNEEFDNHALTGTSGDDEQSVKSTIEGTNEPSGGGGGGGGSGNQSIVSNSEEISGQTPTSSHQKSILMHVDEKVVPASDFTITRGLNVHPQNLAPYGRFSSTSMETVAPPTMMTSQQVGSGGGQSHIVSSDQMVRSSEQSANADRDQRDSVHNNIVQIGHQIGLESSSSSSSSSSNSGVGQASMADVAKNTAPLETQTREMATSGVGSQIVDQQQSNMLNSKDMPLRFSILVGENQAPTNGIVSVDQPSVLIMNSTSTDMDHIVIPGKKGQLEDSSDQISTTHTSISSTQLPSRGGVDGGEGYEETTSFLNGVTRNRQGEPNKRNASYEQTFDALPSNSISSEIHMNQRVQQQQHQQHQQRQHQHNSVRSIQTGNVQDVAAMSESAASHDCQLESGKSRIRTIIWTGGIVIALNICLVILSLVMYFRKVRLRQNHMIDRSVFGDCGTQRASDGNRWPSSSVILKSKNKLSTSLNAHEHFFCKLNSKPGGASGLEHDFNWPNLSSSSSRSTVSSLASPVPSTSIRINQMRPSLKSAAFDSHSSLRNGNFNTGLHVPQKGSSMMNESNHRDKFNARYTNNIDILNSDRF